VQVGLGDAGLVHEITGLRAPTVWVPNWSSTAVTCDIAIPTFISDVAICSAG